VLGAWLFQFRVPNEATEHDDSIGYSEDLQRPSLSKRQQNLFVIVVETAFEENVCILNIT
jgi:hypothetical protein